MSTKRTKIVTALANKLKDIDGTNGYTTNLFGNSFPKLKFWDEVNDFPSIYMSVGSETRDYMPSQFAWGFLNVSIKAYVRGEDAHDQLEALLADIETCIDKNRNLVWDETTQDQTTEILIQSITTDEGLLAPYGVGEINIEVRYPIITA